MLLKTFIHHQKLNFELSFECCRCEQPISSQNFFFTAISLDAHNNNIRNLAQNSASAYVSFSNPSLTTLRDELATDLYELEEEYYSSQYKQ